VTDFCTGHLSAISKNTLIGATNDETSKIGSTVDYEADGAEAMIPEMAERWKARGQDWMVVTDVRRGPPSHILIELPDASRSMATAKDRRENMLRCRCVRSEPVLGNPSP
jgi:hypothetical protein